MKKNKAITLIALIITIIVLLILAGISILMLTGDNGILSKSKTAKENSDSADIEEQNKLGKYNNMMDSYITSRGTTDSNFIWDIGSNYMAKKYDNGVMELYGKYSGIMNVNLAWVTNIYYQDLVNMNFPVQFTSSPYVVPVLCRETSGLALNIIPKNINSTGFSYYVISIGGTLSNSPYSVSYTAIGHWK